MQCPMCELVEFEQNFRAHLSEEEYNEEDYDASLYMCPECGTRFKLVIIVG